MADLADTLARRYAVMRPFLSEFQRRLWLGAEAAELGPGGVAVVAGATGVAADTVRRGRAEADAGTGPGEGRSRRSGAGDHAGVVDRSADQGRSDVAVAVDVEVDPGPDPGVAGARPPGHRHGDASIAA